MKKYTNNGIDFVTEGKNVTIDGVTYYCPNKTWLNNHGYYEYVALWGEGVDGVKGSKWVHYKGIKPAPQPQIIQPQPIVEESLEQVRAQKLKEIDEYDQSSDINGFVYNGETMWIDKATRVGIMNAIECTMTLGEDIITFGIQEVSVTIPCATAIKMMSQLEVYALNCYNTTLQHKRTVSEMTDINEIKEYDITSGYPEKLIF